MRFNFDNNKQRKTAKKLLVRLSKGPINGRQAAHFMKIHSEFKDERSYDFLEELVNSSTFPVKKKGDKLLRSDLDQAVNQV